jgi:hypothetical protein
MSILKISLNSITLSVYVSGAEGVKWMLNMHLQVLTQLCTSLFVLLAILPFNTRKSNNPSNCESNTSGPTCLVKQFLIQDFIC